MAHARSCPNRGVCTLPNRFHRYACPCAHRFVENACQADVSAFTSSYTNDATLTDVLKQLLPHYNVLLRSVALACPFPDGQLLLDAGPYRFDTVSRTLWPCGSLCTYSPTAAVRLVRPVRTGRLEYHAPRGWLSCYGLTGASGCAAGDRVPAVRHTRDGHIRLGGQRPNYSQRCAVSVCHSFSRVFIRALTPHIAVLRRTIRRSFDPLRSF